jgi:cytochrome c oxidase subunit 2
LSPQPSSTRRGRRRNVPRRLAALVGAGVVLTGCSGGRELYESSLSFGVPDPVTDQAQSIYDLYLGSNAAALIVGAFVLGLILFACVRYRKTSDELPRQVRYNLPVEVLYTVVPFVIIAVLFYYTVLGQNFVNDLSTDEATGESTADVQIDVVGFQWNWEFQYRDAGVRVIGETDRPAQLVLPTDRTVRFTQTSPDVIHSFYVPAFLFKRDVIPGRANTFEITPRKEGVFVGRCAELCGEKHAFMNFSVRVVSPAEYDAYLAGLETDPNAAILTASAGSAP